MKTKKIIGLSIIGVLFFTTHTIGKTEKANSRKPFVTNTQSSDTSFPICTAQDDQGFARPIYNKKDDEYLIIWKDYRDAGIATLETPGVIYGQRISPAGELIGDEIEISTKNTEIIRYMPTSSYDPINNAYLAIYLKDWDLYGQFINSDGSLRGEEFVICDEEGNQMHPAVEYSPTNKNFFIIWNDRRKGPGESDIYGVFVNSDGSLAGEEFIICEDPKDQFAPSMAYNSIDDEFMVTYEDFQTCTIEPCYSDVSSLYGIRISINGDLIGNSFLITTGGYDSRQQNLSHNPNRNEYIIAWNDKRNQGDESNIDIYGRIIAKDGTLPGEDFPICTASNDQGYCTVPYDPFNKIYLMVWNDFRDSVSKRLLNYNRPSIMPSGGGTLYGNGTVYGRWYNDNGQPLGSEFPISEAGMGKQMLAKARYYITGENQGTFCVVWTDMRNEETFGDIYGIFLQPPTCPATVILGEKNSCLDTLRSLRDNILSKTEKGKFLIDTYYNYGNGMSEFLKKHSTLRNFIKIALNNLIPLLDPIINKD